MTSATNTPAPPPPRAMIDRAAPNLAGVAGFLRRFATDATLRDWRSCNELLRLASFGPVIALFTADEWNERLHELIADELAARARARAGLPAFKITAALGART